jgi:membrane-bound lytic murein transglycosylase D
VVEPEVEEIAEVQGVSGAPAPAEPAESDPGEHRWPEFLSDYSIPMPILPPEWILPMEVVEDDYEELVSPLDEEIISEIKEGLEEAPEQEITYDVPIEFNSQVTGYIEIFQTLRRKGFEKGLRRVKKYERMMKDIFAEEGLPIDLYYLGLIESGYNPKAYSRAKAMGPWQFIESTGRLYGLKRDWWIDERRDPERSTRAAARHLKDLYRELNSWPLAMAAYNAGLGRVRRAIKKAGTNDFWSLKLPTQTKYYVPAFMAATIIAKEPEKYGFRVDYEPPLEFGYVEVDECTDMEVIAECAGTDLKNIRELNPELRRWCTPPRQKNYRVVVPAGAVDSFNENYALVPRENKVSWRRYKIARGDSLSTIAHRFGTSITAIMDVNGLKSRSFIRAGSYLLIPVPGERGNVSRNEIRKVASKMRPGSPSSAGRKKVLYHVRRGDTLWDISQNHGVSVSALKQWNPSIRGSTIHPGKQLVIWPGAAASGGVGDSRKTSEKFTYLVKRGDTLWEISRRFKTDLDEICRLNGLRTSEKIYPGDQITIPGQKNL